MKIIQIYLNIVYFSLFKALVSIKYSKDYLDSNTLKILSKDARYERFGIDLIFSSGLIFGYIFLIITLIFNIINNVIFIGYLNPFLILFLLVLLTTLISYLMIFKNKKYLDYFEDLDKASKKFKRICYFLTFVSLPVIYLLFFFSIKL